MLDIDHAPGFLIGVRCHYCSRFVAPGGAVHFGESMVRCLRCHENHLAALEVLAGDPPRGCGECRVTFEELKLRTRGAEVSMFLHMKDGIYQLLCGACDRVYVAKRVDLYGPTQFGKSRGLGN
jgi:hypothetical protein